MPRCPFSAARGFVERFIVSGPKAPAPAAKTAAVSLGVFIGCLPLYGLHLLICWTVGFALGLNRLKMYLAANISNPFVAPVAHLRGDADGRVAPPRLVSSAVAATRSRPQGLASSAWMRSSAACSWAESLAVLAATGTYALVRGSGGDPMLCGSRPPGVGSVSRRQHHGVGVRARQAPHAIRCTGRHCRPAMLPPGGTLLDIGCGQGLTLALLVEARQAFDERRWPASWPEPPRFDRMVGIETRPRPAASARKALDGDAEVIHGDARTLTIEPARAVLLFDVLQLLESHEQDALLGSLASRLEPAGVVLIREADPAAGWRFTAVRVGNGLKALVFRTRRTQTFNPRTPGRMARLLCAPRVPQRDAADGRGTPFANVLFRLTRAADESARTVQPALPA